MQAGHWQDSGKQDRAFKRGDAESVLRAQYP